MRILRFIYLFLIFTYISMYYLVSLWVPRLWSIKHFISILSGSGTLVIKLGQILSLRPDLCGLKLSNILKELRQNVKPIDMNPKLIINDNKVWTENYPLACGSIAQVYFGLIYNKDKYTNVVFKILKPGITEEIEEDLSILRKITRIIDYFRPLLHAELCLNKLSGYIVKQTNLTTEKENMEIFRSKGYNVPKIYDNHCKHNILCMEYIKSEKIDDENKHKLYMELCNKMMSKPCFLHLDLHPGNIIWNNEKAYLIDMGLAEKIDDKMYDLFVSSILALLCKDYVKFGKSFIQPEDKLPDGWIVFVKSLFNDDEITMSTIFDIFIKVIGSLYKFNIAIDERISPIIMSLIIVNSHYNELCLNSGKKYNFIEDIIKNVNF